MESQIQTTKQVPSSVKTETAKTVDEVRSERVDELLRQFRERTEKGTLEGKSTPLD